MVWTCGDFVVHNSIWHVGQDDSDRLEWMEYSIECQDGFGWLVHSIEQQNYSFTITTFHSQAGG